MPEYIEREALLKDISESVVFTVRSNTPYLEMRGAQKIIDRIKSAPTADVVEVVRCKDCKSCDLCYPKKDIGKDAVIGYYCKLRKHCVDPTAYCSYGKRKEGAEE